MHIEEARPLVGKWVRYWYSYNPGPTHFVTAFLKSVTERGASIITWTTGERGLVSWDNLDRMEFFQDVHPNEDPESYYGADE